MASDRLSYSLQSAGLHHSSYKYDKTQEEDTNRSKTLNHFPHVKTDYEICLYMKGQSINIII